MAIHVRAGQVYGGRYDNRPARIVVKVFDYTDDPTIGGRLVVWATPDGSDSGVCKYSGFRSWLQGRNVVDVLAVEQIDDLISLTKVRDSAGIVWQTEAIRYLREAARILEDNQIGAELATSIRGFVEGAGVRRHVEI